MQDPSFPTDIGNTSVRIGLIRHFPVVEALPKGWLTASELDAWRRRYDASGVLPVETDLSSIRWRHCISSDLSRAVETARTIYPGEVEVTSLLREPDFQFRTSGLRLPVLAWRLMLAISWLIGFRSQGIHRDDFQQRVIAVADLVNRRAGDTLVVSHAGMMRYLSAELRRRGFVGPRLKIPHHAKLYLYERS